MSEAKTETPNYVTRENLSWLERRVDRLQTQMDEQCAAHIKRIRLLVRILVDKKIIGEEIAKSVEETFGENDAVFNWFMKEIQEAAKDPKYKIKKMKGKFAVMMATGKKFPPWRVLKSFPTKPEAQAHIDKLTKKSK